MRYINDGDNDNPDAWTRNSLPSDKLHFACNLAYSRHVRALSDLSRFFETRYGQQKRDGCSGRLANRGHMHLLL